MSVTKWYLLRFDEKSEEGKSTKHHVAPASLVRQLLLNLERRGCNITTTPKAITKIGTEDNFGMVHQGRPWEDFALSGLTFSVPAEEVLAFYTRIQGIELRRFERGAEYYKLHGVMNCIVLKPVHKLALELQLHERIKVAEERAHIFYADKKTVGEVLREAYSRVSGKPIEEVAVHPGDAQPNDRFFPRERGQA